MSIPSELGHLAMPTNFLAIGKKIQMAQASFEPRDRKLKTWDLSIPSLRCAAAPHWLGSVAQRR